MLYPLKFKAVYKDYLWGGRELEKLGKHIPKGIVAESWEISAHPDGESIVSNGEYAGISLSRLLDILSTELIGDKLKDLEKFPLLIKFIDANKKLSVQVHPNDKYAKEKEKNETGKNEMWYIISAKPGSKIVYGVKPGTTKDMFMESLMQNKAEEYLNYLEVSPGDVINIPAGLIHAIGEGILLAEIQQNSNLTYRVFDYNRVDAMGNKRELHIEKAKDVICFDNCNVQGIQKSLNIFSLNDNTKELLIENHKFVVEKYLIKNKIEEKTDGNRFYIYICIEGEGEINYPGGKISIEKGESVLIPAFLGEYNIQGSLQLLKAYVPDLDRI